MNNTDSAGPAVLSNDLEFARLFRLLGNVDTTIKVLLDSPGTDPDIFQSATALLLESTVLRGDISTRWGDISKRGEEKKSGAFRELSASAEDLYRRTVEAYRRNHKNSVFKENAAVEIEANTKELEAALTYHRSRAREALWILIALSLVTIASIPFLFDVRGLDSHPITLERGLMMFGGRIAALAVLGSLVAFVAKLHSSHAQQSVIYQDRLAGLGAAKLIIFHGQAAAREQIISQMASTYLSLEQNAFRPSSRRRSGLSLKDIERIAKLLKDSIPGVSK